MLPPTPSPAPDPDAPVDPRLDAMAAAAAANLAACWNAADWPAVSQSVTPRFLRTALGIDATSAAGRAQALAALDLGPLAIETVGPVTHWSDGRGAVEVRYRRGAYQVVSARWFLVAERGIARFDEEALLPPPPLGDRVTIGFAIADDRQPLQWSSPASPRLPPAPVIALHGANRGQEPHTFILSDAGSRTIGLLTLPPWTQGDLLLLALPAGTYRLRDPAVPPSALTLEVGERGWQGGR